MTEQEKQIQSCPIIDSDAKVLLNDVRAIIEQAQETAYRAVNETLIKRNWLLGMRIQHEVLQDQRAEYGEQVIRTLAKSLTEIYGKGFSRNNLYRFISFYKSFDSLLMQQKTFSW